MGFWGVICEFDVRHYRDVVVPAFRAGERHSVIASSLAQLNSKYSDIDDDRFEGLAEMMRWFTPDLDDCLLGRDFVAPAGWDRDLLARLFEYVLLRETVRSWANLASTGSHLWQLWDFRDRVDRGEVVVLYELEAGPHFWPVDGAGPIAWLDAEWTRELAAELPAPGTDEPPPGARPPEWVRDRQRRFRLVLDRALQNGHGLLWGRDLALPHDEHLYADGRTPPVELRP